MLFFDGHKLHWSFRKDAVSPMHWEFTQCLRSTWRPATCRRSNSVNIVAHSRGWTWNSKNTRHIWHIWNQNILKMSGFLNIIQSSTIISLNTNFSKAPDASSFAANSCLRMSPGPYDSTFQNIEVSQRNKTQWSQGNHPPKCEGSRSAKKQRASRGQTTRSMSWTSNPDEQMSAINVINFLSVAFHLIF